MYTMVYARAMKITEMHTREARADLAGVITRSQADGQVTILTRYNKPCAAVVPIGLLEQALAALARTEQGE